MARKLCRFCGQEFDGKPRAVFCSRSCWKSDLARAAYNGGHRACLKCGETKPLSDFRDLGERGHQRTCIACANRKQLAYSIANKERVKSWALKSRANNRDKINARKKARYYADPQGIGRQTRAALRRRMENDPAYDARIKAYWRKQCSKRRALEETQGDGVTPEQWFEILRLHDNSCAYCGKKDVALSQEHVHPLSRGGSNTGNNIVPACISCNSSKRDKTLDEWFLVKPEIKAAILARAING